MESVSAGRVRLPVSAGISDTPFPVAGSDGFVAPSSSIEIESASTGRVELPVSAGTSDNPFSVGGGGEVLSCIPPLAEVIPDGLSQVPAIPLNTVATTLMQ
jgi:hypothetical protein